VRLSRDLARSATDKETGGDEKTASAYAALISAAVVRARSAASRAISAHSPV
jgi:hypothetical protein